MGSKDLLLGYDIGSSSIKASLLDSQAGSVIASATSPRTELPIAAPRPGWAEQEPEVWWEHVKLATHAIAEQAGARMGDVGAIGISYQMHGLVLVDRTNRVLRPAIIWCDSRAVEIGDRAFREIGEETCRKHLLNSPGNFTASKLKWVKENEPEVYKRIDKAMLPGDFIAMRMTGEIRTTPSGLSEGILWDFRQEDVARLLLDHYGISPDLLPRIVPTFAEQGTLTAKAAEELGLKPGVTISYRAGDQPNNAFSLNVLNPGEMAATAGTSGVVYGVSDRPRSDARSRVNVFAHVNHLADSPRYGILLCLNGVGIMNSWMRRVLSTQGGTSMSYDQMNALAASAPAGSDGLVVLPYGNGAERTLCNRNLGASVHNLDLNRHGAAHMLRAAQEGIAFSMQYGLEIMKEMGVRVETVRAGHANMFLSPLFAETFATITGARVELFHTDGAQGAARGAGVGAGIYPSAADAFVGLRPDRVIEPNAALSGPCHDAYTAWRKVLDLQLC